MARYRLELLLSPERQDGQDPSRLGLAPVGLMLAACSAAAVIGLGVLNVLALVLLHSPAVPPSSAAPLHDLVGVLWPALVFASVAGAGLIVAIIIARRRQRAVGASSVAGQQAVGAAPSADPQPPADNLAPERAEEFGQRLTAIAARFGPGQDKVRLADVQDLAILTDEWAENRQSCVNVLCGYLQTPYQPEPPAHAPVAQRLAFRRVHELRHTAIQVIAAHLRKDAAVSWQGLDFDLSGVVFDGGDFSGAVFRHGTVSFDRAVFCGDISFERAEFRGDVSFERARFAGGTADFGGAMFRSGMVSFERAEFAAGKVSFAGAVFSGGDVGFMGGEFSGGDADFSGAIFSGAEVGFPGARFAGGAVSFSGAGFSGGTVSFSGAVFSGSEVDFERAGFVGGAVRFDFARFTGTEASFLDAGFASGTVSFSGARFTGGKVQFGASSADVELGFFRAGAGAGAGFERAGFTGGTVDFSRVTDWSQPPAFDWDGPPPAGLKLPAANDEPR
ncbi:MAG TPA: pentapeptide repeat-containing protein [Streptosporangiaceae bacterium]|nr:pentapeptide repeat-containing protein [Streptosporangiaceae bacterium]